MPAPRPEFGETFDLEMEDLRADNSRRTVSLSRERVVISRRRDGVHMRIALRPQHYLGVLLRVDLVPGGFCFNVILAHRDPEFGVELFSSRDRDEAQASWAAWARYTGAAALVERESGRLEAVSLSGGRRVTSERRRRGVGRRRPRFLARRRVGDPGRAVPVGGEELFGGWRDGV